MSAADLLMLIGLGLAAWGHVLLHNLFGAAVAWRRVDDQFPPSFRSPAPVAGVFLLCLGTMSVLLPILG